MYRERVQKPRTCYTPVSSGATIDTCETKVNTKDNPPLATPPTLLLGFRVSLWLIMLATFSTEDILCVCGSMQEMNKDNNVARNGKICSGSNYQ